MSSRALRACQAARCQGELDLRTRAWLLWRRQVLVKPRLFAAHASADAFATAGEFDVFLKARGVYLSHVCQDQPGRRVLRAWRHWCALLCSPSHPCEVRRHR